MVGTAVHVPFSLKGAFAIADAEAQSCCCFNEAELSTPPKIIPAIVSVLTWASLEFGVSTPPAGAGGLLPGGNGGPGGPGLLLPGGAGGAFDSEK